MLTFLTQAVRIGMTLLFGSTGETITEKSGHLNLGVPGVMCIGAAFGCVSETLYISKVGPLTDGRSFFVYLLAVLIPILAAIIGGALSGLLYSVLTVSLRSNQNVTGLVLTTFGVGLSKLMITSVQKKIISASAGGVNISFTQASKYFTASLPFASKLGVIGKLLFSYGIMIYLAIAIALIVSYVLSKTRLGLHLRSVGENPATADAAGINVSAYRYGATCVGCAISALGGLTFIMDNLNGNWEYIIDAMGWLSVALVIFTVWKPNIGILGSIIFGGLYIAASYINGISLAIKELFKILPYFVTVVVLIITSIRNKRENQPPAGLGANYFREER